MTATRNLFNRVIQLTALAVKGVNEKDVDVEHINEIIERKEIELQSMSPDSFLETLSYTSIKPYCRGLLGDYFIDRRCWNYLVDSVQPILANIGCKFVMGGM